MSEDLRAVDAEKALEETARRVYISAMGSGLRNLLGEAHKLEVIKSAIRSAEAAAIERCIEIAQNERLIGDTREESDHAYNTAIEHVVAAIRRGGN